MRFLKWTLFAVVIFAVAWTVFATLNQEPFQAPVAARILRYQTPAIAVKYYLVVAFFGGLAIGLAVAIYYYATLSARLYKRNKTIKELTQQNRMLEEQVAEKESAAHAEESAAPEPEPVHAPAAPDSAPREEKSDTVAAPDENHRDKEDASGEQQRAG
jgi:hypothetical protein